MSYVITVIVLLLVATGNALAGGRVVTFYSDGAIVEIETAAVRGTAEISLPAGMAEDSLRIKPLGNTLIQRVEIISSRQDGKSVHELNAQLELKSRLEDRLKALETKEEIFKAAAKAQSGKAPRKTKTNPDPMRSIRQGTEFAIEQLEAVYTARRKTEQEIQRCETRIATLKKGESRGQKVARVTVSPKNGKIVARYALEGQGWAPAYDLRLNGDGNGRLTLYGRTPGAFEGYLLKVSPGSMSDGKPALISPVSKGAVARLAEYSLPVREERFVEGSRSSFSFVLVNSSDMHLPAGEATLYRNGEYWGRFRFEAISSGGSKRITP